MSKFKIEVQGIVQGVGFRPFVYNLTLKLNLTGYVNNDDKGVNILLEGKKNSIDAFLNELKNNPPVLGKRKRENSKVESKKRGLMLCQNFVDCRPCDYRAGIIPHRGLTLSRFAPMSVNASFMMITFDAQPKERGERYRFVSKHGIMCAWMNRC